MQVVRRAAQRDVHEHHADLPAFGAFWPGGLGALWVIAAAMVAFLFYRLWLG